MSSIKGYEMLYNTLLNDEDVPIHKAVEIKRKIVGGEPPTRREVGDFLFTIFYDPEAKTEDHVRFFRHISNMGYLERFLPELEKLKTIPQRKGRLRVANAFDHTVMVMKYADKPLLKLLALYHDVGKSYCKGSGYRGHDLISARMAFNAFNDFGYSSQSASLAFFAIANHMLPHEYQRRTKNKWTDEQVGKFTESCGTISFAFLTIWLAIADKRASHDVAEYLEPYHELERRVAVNTTCEACTGKTLIILCPRCLKEDEEAVSLGYSRSTELYTCGRCKTRYVQEDGGRLALANVVDVIAEVTSVKGVENDGGQK